MCHTHTGNISLHTLQEAAVEKAVREKILERRSTVHERCKTEVEKRSRFEDGVRVITSQSTLPPPLISCSVSPLSSLLSSPQIKRPYFHVKPLERAQLRNWREYLDFEIAEGNQRRILILFERCMVACALYEDFWIKVRMILSSEKHQRSLISWLLPMQNNIDQQPGQEPRTKL